MLGLTWLDWGYILVAAVSVIGAVVNIVSIERKVRRIRAGSPE